MRGRKPIKISKEQEKLYKELKKEAQRANYRIKSIEKRYGENAWGVRSLRSKLEIPLVSGLTKKGNVRVSKKMTEMQMRAVKQALKIFLSPSGIGSLRGIARAKAKGIETLKERYDIGVDEMGLTDKELESIYEIFSDKDVNIITLFIPGSSVLDFIQDAISRKYTKIQFINELEEMADKTSDSNFKTLANKIYNKYYKPFRRSIKKQDKEQNYFEFQNKIDSAVDENDLSNLWDDILDFGYYGNITPAQRKDLLERIDQKRDELRGIYR